MIIKNTKLASSRLVESFQPLDLLAGYEEWRVNEIYNSLIQHLSYMRSKCMRVQTITALKGSRLMT